MGYFLILADSLVPRDLTCGQMTRTESRQMPPNSCLHSVFTYREGDRWDMWRSHTGGTSNGRKYTLVHRSHRTSDELQKEGSQARYSQPEAGNEDIQEIVKAYDEEPVGFLWHCELANLYTTHKREVLLYLTVVPTAMLCVDFGEDKKQVGYHMHQWPYRCWEVSAWPRGCGKHYFYQS